MESHNKSLSNMSATDCKQDPSRDLVFHLLDLHSRDLQVESETEDTRMVTYDAEGDEEEDEEFQSSRRRQQKSSYNFAQRREFVVHLFGATEQGQPVRCDVTGFRPSFYIRLPLEKTAEAQTSIRNYIKNQGIPLGELNMTRVHKKVFYGFTASTLYPFLQIDVPSLAMFRNLRNLFLDDQLRFATRGPLEAPLRGATIEVFEANIDPMLRFLHTQDIQPCNWVLVRDGCVSMEEQNGTLVVECDYEQVVPTKGPRATAPFLTASWDIECFSMTGDFPLPRRTWVKAAKEVYELARGGEHAVELVLLSLSVGQTAVETLPKGMTPIYCSLKKRMEALRAEMKQVKYYAEWEAILARKDRDSAEEVIQRIEKCLEKQFKGWVVLQGDPCIQIGTTLTRGTVETTERHLFVFPDCAPIPGIEVHAFATEGAMILGWFEWMKERSPDILIGYNVFGFDESYVWHRAEELKIITPNSPIHALNRLSELGGEMKLEEKFLSSSAMGDNRMYIWTTQGRLQVDMFHYIKRNYQLPSYKLDEVTKYFMSGKIKSYVYDEATRQLQVTVDGAVKDVRVGRSITLLDETGETVTPKLAVMGVNGSVLHFDCTGIKQDDLDNMLAELDDAVSWVVVKDDVGPQDIFRLHRGSAEDRAVVGKYCLQDCDLVIDLYKKIKTFTNSMSMANVCSVPITYIFVRGQGIKIESLIFKFCREKEVVIPVLPTPKQGGEDSYEGAIVLDPQPGFYSTSTIGVCDFASLYPSTIVSENISHDSLLWVKDFTNDGTLIAHQWGCEDFDDWKGYAYTDIEYDIIRPDPEDHRKVPRKVKCGRRICRFAQPLDGSKSTLPQITTWLLKARSAKKKEMAKENDPEQKALLDAEQLAYKLTGNSLYGQLGSGTFKIRLQALAASVTAYGRKQILFAKAAIEKFYGPEAKDPRCTARCMAKVVYGDSVTGDTPLVLRDNLTNTIFMRRVDELYNDEDWAEHHGTKEFIDTVERNISVWTERGFTPIRKVIRHRLAPTKKLFRIHTHTGVVDVTEDHSLVLSDGSETKPGDVTVGTELLHNDTLYQEFDNVNQEYVIDEKEAFVMGLFVADGSSDVYQCKNGAKKATWAINKADIGLLNTARLYCPFETKILNTIESSGVFKLVPVGDLVTPARRYRQLFYNSHREKRIPQEILTAPLPIVQAFWNGFYAGDGDKDIHEYIRFDQKGKEIGAGLYLLARRLGYSVSINDRTSKESVFRYTMTKSDQRKNPIAIKKIRELPHPGNEVYVYDLETENHHFGVGPGALIVHNTDSLFVEFNMKNPETGEPLTGLEGRMATMAMTDEAGHFITKCLAPPHDFEFDKAFDPLLMFSKKRYAGNMYEDKEAPEKYCHKYMGIALKRRDNAPIVKTIFGGAMKMLLDKRDVEGAFNFVRAKCLELVKGEASLGQLTITKSLRADYADPSRIAHKALADRITTRDPGNAPAAGDRIGYVYILPKAGQEASKLQGDRIETPQYIREHGLAPDFRHYIEHQLQNPISQAFGLLLERIPGYTADMMRGCPSMREDLDRYLGFREEKAAQLLFSECLQYCERISKRNAMAGMFKLAPSIGSVAASTKKPKTQGGERVISVEALPVAQKKASSMVQQTMSGFLLDSLIVNNIKKKDRAKKKAMEEDEKQPVKK